MKKLSKKGTKLSYHVTNTLNSCRDTPKSNTIAMLIIKKKLLRLLKKIRRDFYMRFFVIQQEERNLLSRLMILFVYGVIPRKTFIVNDTK